MKGKGKISVSIPTKRSLTEDELKYITSFVKPNTMVIRDIAEATRDRIVGNIIIQLRKFQVYPQLIDKLKNRLEVCYHKVSLSAGEMVGVLGSTYIAEIITQLTLNSFHFSGLSAFSISYAGVPRIQEIMNATKRIKFPSMVLYMKKELLTGDKMKDLNTIFNITKNKVEEFYLRDLLLPNSCNNKKIDSEKDIIKNRTLTDEEKEWYFLFFTLYNSSILEKDNKKKKKDTDTKGLGKFKYEWSIRLNLNNRELFKRKITLLELSKKIEIFRDLYCVFSPDHIGIIDIYVDIENVEIPSYKDVNGDYGESSINDENKDEYFIKNAVLDYLHSLQIGGITDIENVYFIPTGGRSETVNGVKVGDKEDWKIETIGSNWMSARIIEELDHTKLFSNNMWEALKCIGIEGARAIIINEIKKVVSGINICHISLLADAM